MNVSTVFAYSSLITLLQHFTDHLQPKTMQIIWEESTQSVACEIRDQLHVDSSTVWTIFEIKQLPKPKTNFNDINFLKPVDRNSAHCNEMVISVVRTAGLILMNMANYYYAEDKVHLLIYLDSPVFPVELLRNSRFNGVVVLAVADELVRYLVWPKCIWNIYNNNNNEGQELWSPWIPEVQNQNQDIKFQEFEQISNPFFQVIPNRELKVVTRLAPPEMFNVTDVHWSKWGVFGAEVFMSHIIAEQFGADSQLIVVDFEIPSQNQHLIEWYKTVTKRPFVLRSYNQFMRRRRQPITMTKYQGHNANRPYTMYLQLDIPHQHVTALYPHNQDTYIILVPNHAKKTFKLDTFLVRVLLLQAWFGCMVFLTILRLAIRYVLDDNKWGSLVEVGTDTMARSLAVSVKHKPILYVSESIIVMFLAIYALLCGICVSGTFFQKLVAKRPVQMYGSLEDINATALPIMLPVDFNFKEFVEWTTKHLNSKVVFAETHDIVERISYMDTSYAFVLPDSYSITLATQLRRREHTYSILNNVFLSYPMTLKVSHWYMADWANTVVQRCIESGIWFRFVDISNHTRQMALKRQEELNSVTDYHYHIEKEPDNDSAVQHHRAVFSDYIFVFLMHLVGLLQSSCVFLLELLVDFVKMNKMHQPLL